VYDLMMGGTVQDSQALDDHLSSLGVLEKEDGTEDVNIWEEPEDNVLYSNEGGELQLRAASVNKLVEKLTHHQSFDPRMIDPFLMTFRTFTSPSTLLEKLTQRFNVPQPEDDDMDSSVITSSIQLHVIDVLKKWIDKYPEDFDEPLRVRVKHFLDYISTTPSAGRAKTLLTTFQKLQASTQKKITYKPVDPPDPIIPTDFFTREWDLLDLDPEEVARQITVCEWMIYMKIRPSELMEQSWSKQKLKYRSPNVLALIRRTNVISNWVTSSIVLIDTIKERAEVMAKFVQIADRLFALNNYNALMSILGGLNASSVSRLKFTIAEMPNNIQKTKKELESIMSSDSNFREYRARLSTISSDTPMIPYLGVYLTDLTFVDENSDYVNGLVNFSKRILVYNIINQIRQRQTMPYRIQPVQQIINKILQLTVMDDSKFFKKSLELEPRGASRESIK